MKKKFDWDKFLDISNKIAVHCKTEREAITFCNMMHNHGLKWNSGESYAKKTNWYLYEGETCYECGGYSPKVWFREEGYEVIDFSDYDFTSEPKKDILNAEFYREKIQEFKGDFMVDRLTGEIEFCNGTRNCKNCLFNEIDTGCHDATVMWLVSPYKPPMKKPVITDVVRKFLEICDPKRYIARGKCGEIYLCEEKPSKVNGIWRSGKRYMLIDKTIGDNLYHGFDSIKWEDDEPWKIADLLKLTECKE